MSSTSWKNQAPANASPAQSAVIASGGASARVRRAGMHGRGLAGAVWSSHVRLSGEAAASGSRGRTSLSSARHRLTPEVLAGGQSGQTGRLDPGLAAAPAIFRPLRAARLSGRRPKAPVAELVDALGLKIEFRKECWFDSGQGHQQFME